jgi:hypothetical protein
MNKQAYLDGYRHKQAGLGSLFKGIDSWVDRNVMSPRNMKPIKTAAPTAMDKMHFRYSGVRARRSLNKDREQQIAAQVPDRLRPENRPLKEVNPALAKHYDDMRLYQAAVADAYPGMPSGSREEIVKRMRESENLKRQFAAMQQSVAEEPTSEAPVLKSP